MKHAEWYPAGPLVIVDDDTGTRYPAGPCTSLEEAVFVAHGRYGVARNHVRRLVEETSNLYTFNPWGWCKYPNVYLLPDRYVQVTRENEPTPIEDYGNYYLTNEELTIQEAFDRWIIATELGTKEAPHHDLHFNDHL